MGILVGAGAALLDDGAPASARGWLGRRDARAKLFGLGSVLVSVTLVKGLAPLLICCLAAWVLALGSGIRPRRLALTLLAVPAFTLALAAPAALNVVTEGRALVTLCRLRGGEWGPWRLPHVLAITDRGAFVATRLLLRTTACVSLASVLAASTRPQEIMRGLRGLGVPAAFVMVAGMMVRYLGLLVQSAEEVHLAKLSRSMVAMSVRRERAWTAATLGEMYRRSRFLAEAVGRAMVSRGYTGEPAGLALPRWTVGDALFALACACFGGGLLWLG